MKVIYVDVSLLKTHAEKYKIQKDFESLGWDVHLHANPSKSLNPAPVIDYYRCMWWENNNPSYPIIPQDCNISEFEPS